MKITSYFINLDRSAGRRRHMETQALQHDLNVERIGAVDGKALSQDQLLAFQPDNSPNRRLTPGEIGCFLSHRAAWRRIADGDTRFGSVFEDDVLLSSGAGTLLADDRWIPETIAIIKTETFHRKALLGPRIVAVPEARSLARLQSRHYGTGGYILSRDCAARFLEATQTFHVPVDHALFCPTDSVLKDLQVFQLTPAICIQQIQVSLQSNSCTSEHSTLVKDRQQALEKKRWLGRSAVKRLGKAPESTIRELRQRVKAYRIGGSWGLVKFR